MVAVLYYHDGPTSPRGVCGLTRSLPSKVASSHDIRSLPGCAPKDMVEPFLVHYPSQDGKWTISAFVYMPYNLARDVGEPGHRLRSRWSNSSNGRLFNCFVQFIVNNGYIVIAPNYRAVRLDTARILAGQPVRYGGRRFAGRAGGRGLDQANWVCRSQEN